MIDVSDEIKQAYDVSTTQVDKIILNNQEYRITNVEFYDDVYNEGNIFGTAIGKCLEFEIENTIDLEEQEIEYQTGIIVDGAIQWISLGNFIIQDVDPNDTTNITKVSAMDYMLKTNIDYETTLNYGDGTVTLLDVLQEACTSSGITLATMEFANSTFIVDSNQFADGTLNRQVIQAVAQISGTIAKIKNNQLYLIGPGIMISKIFTLNNYKEAEIKRVTHPINLVSLGMADVEGENVVLRDEDSITINGENSLVINDNPFAYTQAKREQLITALFDTVKGFEYKAFSFKCQGLPYLETMDKIQFLDKERNSYDSYVFRFNYKSPNGLESTIEAPSIIKAVVNYQNVASALDIAKRTEIIVDKQNQTITQIAEKTTQIETDVANNATDINNNYQDIIQQLGDYAKEADVISIKESVETIQNETSYAIEVAKKIQTDGVTRLDTKTGYTFDEDGLTIEKTNAKTKTTLNEVGLDVKDATGASDESLLFAGYDETTGETIVKSKNMTVEKYFVIGKYSRMEDFVKDGVASTGMFWVRSDRRSKYMYRIYKLTFPSGKIYIGITSRTIKERIYSGYDNKFIKKEISNCGWESVKKEELYQIENEEDAFQKEIDMIKFYDSTNPEIGYNQSTGGQAPHKGSKMSPKNKEQLIERLKNNKYHLNQKHTEETKRKISELHKGKHHSRKTEFPARRVICIQTGEIFESLNMAERATGVNHSKISMVCQGKRKSANGFTWKYVVEEVG